MLRGGGRGRAGEALLKTIPTYPESFDATLDLQGLLKSALCVMRAKAKRKVGYHWQREGSWLFSGRVQPDPTSFHVVDQYVDVARAVGGVMDRAEFGLRPREEDLVSVRGKLTEAGVEGKFVAVNAGAGWATKRWPAEHFAALIAELPYVPCVLIGGPGDREVAEAVRAGAPGAPSLVGETSVRELVALLSLASAHVGGDTGSTHIAAALGVPAVGLYSPHAPPPILPLRADRALPLRSGGAVPYPAGGRSEDGARGVGVTLEEALRAREGKRLVFTNGVFDLLHAGHVRYLEEARALGDLLFVGVNSDASVRLLGKGPDRPLNPLEDRMAVLQALRLVDGAIPFDGRTPEPLVEALRPEVYAKGGDYRMEDLPEARIVGAYGGEVRLLPFLEGRSTTGLLKRMDRE